jgi:hypothetical protein
LHAQRGSLGTANISPERTLFLPAPHLIGHRIIAANGASCQQFLVRRNYNSKHKKHGLLLLALNSATVNGDPDDGGQLPAARTGDVHIGS